MKNLLLRTARHQRGWSQQHLADFAGLSLSTIERAERGEALRIDNLERLCTCLEQTPEQLGLLNVKGKSLDGMKLLHHSHLNETLDHIESIIDLAWEAWFAANPKQAAREITKLLPGLEKTIYTPSLSAAALRASELAIRAHGLLGCVSLDALHNEMALFHYTQAQTYAEEIRDKDLMLTYMALLGDVLRRQNKKREAIACMEEAKDKAIGTTHATQGHVLQLLAYAYADAGNEAGFEKTIHHATDLLGCTGEGRDAAKKEFNPFEIYEIQGKANRDLGRPQKALVFFDAAEKSLGKATSIATPRFYALLAISRGQAYCDAGDLTVGIDAATRGFLLANQCDSARQMNRVRKLVKKLERPESPYRGERKIGELKDLLYETYLHKNMD